MAWLKFFVADDLEFLTALTVHHWMRDAGHTLSIVHIQPEEIPSDSEISCDVACFMGMKSGLKASLDNKAIPWVFFGPSYHQRGRLGHQRVAVCDIHPLHWLTQTKIEGTGGEDTPIPWTHIRGSAAPILVCGASEAFHDFMGLPDPKTWLAGLVTDIRKHTDRPIAFRAKPGHDLDVPGVEICTTKKPITEDLARVHSVVVHSSNACLDAFTHGVPCVVLGNGVTKSISVPLSQIESPVELTFRRFSDFYIKIKLCEYNVSSRAAAIYSYRHLIEQLEMHPRTSSLFRRS